MKIIFWLFVCFDIAVLGLFFLLGLAAAPSSKTSPFAVAAFMLVVPGILLAVSILLFHYGKTPILRILALVLVAAPVFVPVLGGVMNQAELRKNMDAQGNLTFFHAGPLRDIATAITQNDAATVAKLAAEVNINSHGLQGMTPLMAALAQLRKTPTRLEVFRALMKAGADPNIGSDYEFPLQSTLQIGNKTGPEPVMLLLASGAKPNQRNQFGAPLYFAAIGTNSNVEVVKALLDHGADINIQDNQGQTVLFVTTHTNSWKVTLLLLQRGANWKIGKSVNGLPFKSLVESYAGGHSQEPGFTEVLEFLRRAE